MLSLVVEAAATVEARVEVYRFRHAHGVRPRDTLLCGVRLLDGVLVDDLDPLAVVVLVREAVSRRIVGTVRTNFAREGGLGCYPDLYAVAAREPALWHSSSVTSGWTISWEAWGGEVPLLLARGLYQIQRSERILCDFLDCTEPELEFFERLGYRRLQSIRNPVRGETHLMRLDVFDESHLYAVNSPLVTETRDSRPQNDIHAD
jgi:hypothetical protein